jgi:hypothetical protein
LHIHPVEIHQLFFLIRETELKGISLIGLKFLTIQFRGGTLISDIGKGLGIASIYLLKDIRITIISYIRMNEQSRLGAEVHRRDGNELIVDEGVSRIDYKAQLFIDVVGTYDGWLRDV